MFDRYGESIADYGSYIMERVAVKVACDESRKYTGARVVVQEEGSEEVAVYWRGRLGSGPPANPLRH